MKNQRFAVGESRRAKLKLDASTVERFAEFSGDKNPIHLDPATAESYGYPRQVAHGVLLVNLLSRLVGMDIPGPGAVLMSQSAEWLAPVFVGDEVEMVATVEGVSRGAGVITLGVYATNQNGERVMQGDAKVKIMDPLTQPAHTKREHETVALVTGGSRGIGAEIARRLSQNDVAVAVNFLESEGPAQKLVQELQSAGGRSQAFAADLGDGDATAELVKEVIDQFGRLDVVVHGASPAINPQKVDQISYSDVESFLKVYLGGAIALMGAASPGMVEREFGRFIFLGTSSMFGAPPNGWGAYVAAKEALWGLAKGMASELGPLGITTNMVSPSVTVTDLTAFIPARVKEVAARTTPMRRLATSLDTAALVAFLASDAAGFINGSNLPVTGGPT